VFRWVDHTGELELELRGTSEEEVFAEGLAAIAELLGGEGAQAGERAVREVDVHASDRGRLLAEWLGELAFLAETEGFVPLRAEALAVDGDGGLRARVAGHLGAPPHLVKAVTYHRLGFARHDEGWVARVVLDV
jgi:SHS2 domain-containing protein